MACYLYHKMVYLKVAYLMEVGTTVEVVGVVGVVGVVEISQMHSERKGMVVVVAEIAAMIVE